MDSAKTIPYSISENNNGTVFTSATYQSAGEKSELMINITKDNWNKAYAGEYEDAVIFRIEYTNK